MRRAARSPGLSMLELMLAMGLLFLCASFLMSMFVVGSRAPRRMQDQAVVELLAQQKLDEVLGQDLSVTIYAATGSFGPTYPDHKYALTTAPTSFDSLVTMLSLEVTSPEGARTTLRALRPPNPDPPAETLLDAQFGCTACHRVPGMATSWPDDSLAPPLDKGALEAAAGRAGQSLSDYITDSVRDPSGYIDDPATYTDDMVGYGYEDATYFGDIDLQTVIEFIEEQ